MTARGLRGIAKGLTHGRYQRRAGQRLLNLFAAEKRNHGCVSVAVRQCGSVDVDARDYAIIAAASNAGESQARAWDNRQCFS